MADTTHEPDGRLETLNRFLRYDDKTPPLFFEGRERERTAVLEKCADIIQEYKELKTDERSRSLLRSAKGGLYVIHGPPGSGKTSLAWEIEPTRGQMVRNEEAPTVARIKAEALCDEQKVVSEIVSQILEQEISGIAGNPTKLAEAAERIAVGMVPIGSALAGIAAAQSGYSDMSGILSIVSDGGEPARSIFRKAVEFFRNLNQAREEGPLRMETLSDLKNVPAQCWNRPLLIVFDEFQSLRDEIRKRPLRRRRSGEDEDGDLPEGTWTKEQKATAKSILKNLQDNELKVPVLGLCAGLSDLPNVMENDLELTRPTDDRIFGLGSLEREEARRVVQRFLEECGIERTAQEQEEWTSQIVETTQGYPQHLRNGLAELGEMLKRQNLDLGRIDVETWKDREAAKRRLAYARRRSAAMQDADTVVAEVMHAVGENGIGGKEFRDTIEIAAGNFDHRNLKRLQWIPDMNPEWFANHLLHQGAVQECPGTQDWKSGMRSFRTWLSRQHLPLHQAAGTRDKEGVERLLERGLDPLERDKTGLDALEIARLEGCRETIRLLEKAVQRERKNPDEPRRRPGNMERQAGFPAGTRAGDGVADRPGNGNQS